MSQTTDASDASTDAPIPALLPRDWPRQLAEVLGPFGGGLGLVADAVVPLVDAWVLAATPDDA